MTPIRDAARRPSRVPSAVRTAVLLLVAAVLPSTAALAASARPSPMGEEFQVNGTTAGDQQQPRVAVAAGGSFMVVWSSSPAPEPPGNVSGVYGRIFDADGRPRGEEFRLSASVAGLQILPRVAVNAAGEYMTVWNNANSAQGRLFSASGQPLGGEIALGTGGFPEVTADPAGGFLVVWYQAFPERLIHAQRFNAQGGRIGSEARFSSPGDADYLMRVTASPKGGFLVTWEVSQLLPDGVVTSLLAQRLGVAGHPRGGPIAVAAGAFVGGLQPVFDADGGFTVVWSSGDFRTAAGHSLYARRYTAAGAAAGDAVLLRTGPWIGASPLAALSLPSGDLWLLWFQVGLRPDPGGGVFSAVFDAAGKLAGRPLRVNSYTAALQLQPAVAASPGGIVAVWASGADGLRPPLPPDGPDAAVEDGDGFGIFGQRFAAPPQ